MRPGSSRCTTWPLRILAALSLLVEGNLLAQEVRPVKITDFDGSAEFGYEQIRQERFRLKSPNFEREQEQFSEELNLKWLGYVYHPKLLKFDIGASLNPRQTDFSGTRLRKEQGGGGTLLTEYDARLGFFQEHPYSFSLFANRRQGQIDQEFGGRFDVESESEGGIFRLRKGPFPTELSITHTNSSQQGLGSNTDETFDTASLWVTNQTAENSRTDLYVNYNDVDSRFDFPGPTPPEARRQQYTTKDARLENLTTFGPQNENRLYSTLRYYDQTGGRTNYSVAELNELLNLEHSKNLASNYSMSLNRTESSGQNIDTLTLDANLKHKWYESFVNTVGGRAYLMRASFGDTDRFAVYGGSDYQKRLSDWGIFQAGYDLNLEREIQDVSGTEGGFIFAEKHGFFFGQPILLTHLGVNSETVIVTDSTGGIIYIPVFDYFVIPVGSGALVWRTPLGRIKENQEVTISYSYSGQKGSADYYTIGQNVNTRLTFFNIFSVYYQFIRQDHHVEEQEQPLRLEDLDGNLYGAQASWKWITALVEYQDHDSTLTPFRTLREEARLTFSPISMARVFLRAAHSNSNYIEDHEEIENRALSGMVALSLTPRASLELTADYQTQDATGPKQINNLEGKGFTAEYRWSYRKLTVTAGYRLSDVDQEVERERYHRLYFNVTRIF